MIPMSDDDVQEIRDRVAEQRAQFEAKQKKIAAVQKAVDERNEHSIPILKSIIASARDERHKRLGIPGPGPSTSGSTSTYSKEFFRLITRQVLVDM
jgi:hypothetical protein